MSLKSFAKSSLLAAVSKITGRHAVLLPREAADETSILELQAPYRVEGSTLRVLLAAPEKGTLRAELLGYEGHFPTKRLWSVMARYEGSSPLTLDLTSGDVRLREDKLGSAPVPLPTRRFCWRLELETSTVAKRRLTGHYVVSNGTGSYFEGDNYVDYEAEAKGDVGRVLSLLAEHDARGPLLEVGCATGLVLAGIADTGVECFGLDSSPWAVEQARKRLGENAAFLVDVELDPIPAVIREKGSFGTLLLWTVLEHFRNPYEVLRKLTELTHPGSQLFIQTTNAASLNRFLFGSQWEGYFDATHHGVDAVSVERLRSELPRMGWRIGHLRTHLSWGASADPTHSTLREWWASDARFRRLLVELDRGDLVTVVATKE